MPPAVFKQEVHRPGPLKQSNKPHKSGRSKGKKHDKGKIDVKAASRRKQHQLNRSERKNQLNQLRKVKREEVLKQKRKLGGLNSEPVLVMILSLDDSVNASDFLDKIQSSDEDLVITESELGHCHISCFRYKQRYTFLMPKKSDLHSVMDALKVCEILLLLHSSNSQDNYTEMLLSVVMGHALPTTIHVVQGLDKLNPKKKAERRKHILKAIEPRFPDAKLHQADTAQDMLLLLRQIGSQKQRIVGFRDNRPHLLVESMSFDLKDASSNKGTLKVSGYVRGQPLNVNGLVHVPGWGTFQMSRIEQTHDPHTHEKFDMIFGTSEDANPLDQESLQSEVVPDPMNAEQTWPTEEELEEAEKQTVKKVPKGTSDYQAAWIIESENDDSGGSDEESCNDGLMASDDDNEEISEKIEDTESIADFQEDNHLESMAVNKEENYDNTLNMDEERQTLVRFKEERLNQMFPDEQDTPLNVPARVRYARYRAAKYFHSVRWDPYENLPEDYARIYRFQNFRQTKKKVMISTRDGVEAGQYVNVFISDVPQSLYDSVNTEKTSFVLYGLLPHEQKMSVVNTVIRKHPSCKVPIKSKDTLIFHIGFHRFTCKPIFSELKAATKVKYERFLPSDEAVMASFYAPVTFPPASVVIFRQRPDGSHQLVATGNVLDINPNRLVVKRIVLSGHPFKIFKRSADVRYMFFNKEDVHYFKSNELFTKLGRQGHIRDSLGTHGHMKCIFDKQLQSGDVVLMSLYKRVFPKWTYDSYVPTPVHHSAEESACNASDDEMETMS